MVNMAQRIKVTQDKDGMLHRALERIIQLYSDRSHFIYELLQNAEDAGAQNIRFVQYDDRLEVLHDGRPFTEKNLAGLCDIGKSDKVDSLNQIGEFGVGFKSVFSICDTVRLYSNHLNYRGGLVPGASSFAIKIANFTDPRDIPEKKFDNAFTTKFVFPYEVGKTFSGFKNLEDLKAAISRKLCNLGISTLLFMKNLEIIEFRILSDGQNITGQYRLEKKAINDHCSLVSALGLSKEGDEKSLEEISYLKFSRRIDSISQRTVDIAFPVKIMEDGSYECQEEKNPYISVYFPTETESKLGFVVQGPFRTTPNRSSIPADDEDNIRLAEETAALVHDTILELRDNGNFNLSFIKSMPINRRAFDNYSLFQPVYDRVYEMFENEKIIPCNAGGYTYADQAMIARSEKLVSIFPDEMLTELYEARETLHWLPTTLTENNRAYKSVYEYLSTNYYIGITVIRPEDMGSCFLKNKQFLYNRDENWLVEFYNFFANVSGAFSTRRGNTLLTVPIIKNSQGKFVAAYRHPEGGSFVPNIFLNSVETQIEAVNYVDEKLYKKCKAFFDDVLHLQRPNEYEFWIKDIRDRYFSIKKAGIDYEQHIEDMLGFCKYLSFREYKKEVEEIMRKASLVKCKDGIMRNAFDERVYLPVDEHEVSLEDYFRNIADDVYFVDVDFYGEHGITIENLKKFGVRYKLEFYDAIVEGTYEGKYKPHWHTEGSFRWFLTLIQVEDVLAYIDKHPYAENAKEKSRALFMVLLANEDKLSGTVYIGGETPDLYNEPCELLSYFTHKNKLEWSGKWLYTKHGEVMAAEDISRYDLDQELYGKAVSNSKIYDLLGFQKTKRDEVEDLKKEVPEERLNAYFEAELYRRYNLSEADVSALLANYMPQTDVEEHFFDESDGYEEQYDFPIRRVRSWEKLRKHVAEVYCFANPVTYAYVKRSIRVSNRGEEARSYLKNMYAYEDINKYACQLCHEPCYNFSAVGMFKDNKKELEQMHVCLCPNCSIEYQRFRNNEANSARLKEDILALQEDEIKETDYVPLAVNANELWFTSRHIAEIQGLLCLDKEFPDTSGHEEGCETKGEGTIPKTTEGAAHREAYVKAIKVARVENINTAERYGSLYVGQELQHSRFGKGTIKGFTSDGASDQVIIKFMNGVEKTLLISILDRFCSF